MRVGEAASKRKVAAMAGVRHMLDGKKANT